MWVFLGIKWRIFALYDPCALHGILLNPRKQYTWEILSIPVLQRMELGLRSSGRLPSGHPHSGKAGFAPKLYFKGTDCSDLNSYWDRHRWNLPFPWAAAGTTVDERMHCITEEKNPGEWLEGMRNRVWGCQGPGQWEEYWHPAFLPLAPLKCTVLLRVQMPPTPRPPLSLRPRWPSATTPPPHELFSPPRPVR